MRKHDDGLLELLIGGCLGVVLYGTAWVLLIVLTVTVLRLMGVL